MARIGLTEIIRCLSAFGMKRTSCQRLLQRWRHCGWNSLGL